MTNHFKKIDANDIAALAQIVGESSITLDDESLAHYGHDQTKNLKSNPEIVVKPANTEGVSQVLRYCNSQKIPVTVQGARSGVSGGAVPVQGGVALSMEKFDKILNIDSENFQVTVEPGVITEHLQNVLKEQGLFYPPDPAGKGWSFIGGNIATNAGGPKCVKYGVTRDYVINLEVSQRRYHVDGCQYPQIFIGI